MTLLDKCLQELQAGQQQLQQPYSCAAAAEVFARLQAAIKHLCGMYEASSPASTRKQGLILGQLVDLLNQYLQWSLQAKASSQQHQPSSGASSSRMRVEVMTMALKVHAYVFSLAMPKSFPPARAHLLAPETGEKHIMQHALCMHLHGIVTWHFLCPAFALWWAAVVRLRAVHVA
jgi:hypothetical protein